MNTLTPPSYAAGSQSLELRNIVGSPDDSAPASHTSLAGVAHEQQWCEPLHSGDGQSQILVSRWRDDRSFAREAFYTVPPDVCLIVVSLQPCLASLVLAGAKTQAQSNPAGVIKIAGPETRLKALWKEGCDELHLHCPIDLIDRIAGRAAPIATHLGKSARSSFVDASLLGLAQTLIASPSAASGFEGMFHQSVAYAIVARALLRGVYERLHESPDMGAVAPRRQQDATGLPAWRLSRVLGHIEHNLRESLSLTELAVDSAGCISPRFFARPREVRRASMSCARVCGQRKASWRPRTILSSISRSSVGFPASHISPPCFGARSARHRVPGVNAPGVLPPRANASST
jgi:hypothetical protein